MKKIFVLILCSIHILNAQNLITSEQFTNCSLPAQWSLATESGAVGFGILKSTLMPQFDPSCSIVYNQTTKNDNSAKKFSIKTKSFSLFAYDQYTFAYGLRFVKSNPDSELKVYLILDGIQSLLQHFTSDVLQNGIVLVPQSKIIATKSINKSAQFVFEYYAAGDDYNAQILIDNLSFSGPDNDDCGRAVELKLDSFCLSGNNTGAFMTGPIAQCNGNYIQGIWYKFVSDYSGAIRLQTLAGFNDAVSVFEGNCLSLNNLNCYNTDEFGFEGERNYFNVESGKTYYFRVAKQTGYYGREDASDICISIQKLNPVPPVNDICSSSKSIQINSTCNTEINIQADFTAPVPSLNQRSRADVWYRFKTSSTQALQIISHADFADVLTVYKGSCNKLEEVQCEDLGGSLVLNNPLNATDYFVQVSGYFSTIEGHLCLEVLTQTGPKPANDECLGAKAITLNQTCQTTTSINSVKSNIRSSCMVYSAPDVWFSFVAPAEKNIAIKIQTAFVYNWAIFSGNCTSLIEFACGNTPDPCNGFLTINGLVPGKTYYLQISSLVYPIKSNQGDVCIQIDELSKAGNYSPVSLTLNEECLHGILGRINYTATGGQGIYTYTGPGPNEIFIPGTQVEAFIQDEAGCRDFDKIIIDCKAPSKCNTSDLDIDLTTECITDSIGRATGEVIMHINGKGGSGAYYIYGTQDLTKLHHGDEYEIILIDSDSCYLVEQGKINCPPFNCNQSNLKITANYICVDTLLKAFLQLDIAGNLGNYSIIGNKHGDLLDHGSNFQTEIVDQAGCTALTQGQIICSFDTCAYSRPSLIIDYDCLLDSFGNKTGKAFLNIQGSSYAGGVTITGNQHGDTLNNLDQYLVKLIDSFGCSLEEKGIIDCIPVSTNEKYDALKTSFEPNPASNDIYIHIPQNKSAAIDLTVFSANGNMVEQFNYQPLKSNNLIKLNINKFPSGILYIRLNGKEFFDIIRIIKI